MVGVSKDELRLDNRGSRKTFVDLYLEGGCDEPRSFVLCSVVVVFSSRTIFRSQGRCRLAYVAGGFLCLG